MYVASGPPPNLVCSNDYPGLTLTYFMTRSNFVTLAFLTEKVKTIYFQKLLQPMVCKLVDAVN